MIREAGLGDIPGLVDRLKRFHANSHYGGTVPFDANSAAATLADLIDWENGVVLLHDHGAIAGLILPFFFNSAKSQAIELFWHADRDGAALLRAFEDWAALKGADAVVMGSVAGSRQDAVDRSYRRRGYRETEHLHMKGIGQW